MIKIGQCLLDRTSTEAKSSPRKRKNHNFHQDSSDLIQRMLNAFEPYSYVQPHKHENPDKREVFIALRGRFAVFEFDCSGAITDHLVLDPQNGSYAAEIPAGIFHTIMALDPGAVAYEVKDGPFFPENDKNFAAWAPKEGSSGVEAYLRELLTKTEIH